MCLKIYRTTNLLVKKTGRSNYTSAHSSHICICCYTVICDQRYVAIVTPRPQKDALMSPYPSNVQQVLAENGHSCLLS